MRPNGNAEPDDWRRDGHADADAHRHPHANADGHADANADANADGHADDDGDGNAFADGGWRHGHANAKSLPARIHG